MKVSSLPLILLTVLLAMLSACKTTEANYKAAYEAAAEHRASKADAEYDFLNRPDQSVIITEFLSVVKTSDKDTITPAETPKFAVAANKFKQVFNAKALCQRLRTEGFGGAYVARNPSDEYYVMVEGFSDEAQARAFMEEIKADKRLPFGRGYPATVRTAWK